MGWLLVSGGAAEGKITPAVAVCCGWRLLVVMMLTGQSVIIGFAWALVVGCLLWLFYEVRVWLGTGWYGYVGMRDSL